MTHSFEVDVAERYGVNAAILFNNIYFWCEKNRANGHNLRDGLYWTHNSRSAFVKLFPYLSERQIKTALDKLIEDGVIKTGCYNEMSRDRTLWYAITDKGLSIVQKCQMQTAEMSNANCGNVRPLPDINHTDINHTDEYIVHFDDFWVVYPRHEAKKDAVKAWKSIKPDGAILATIIADIKDRLAPGGAWYKAERQYIPLPATYLRGARWEDEPSAGAVNEAANTDEPWWKDKPWWEWPLEERRKREQQMMAREGDGG